MALAKWNTEKKKISKHRRWQRNKVQLAKTASIPPNFLRPHATAAVETSPVNYTIITAIHKIVYLDCLYRLRCTPPPSKLPLRSPFLAFSHSLINPRTTSHKQCACASLNLYLGLTAAHNYFPYLERGLQVFAMLRVFLDLPGFVCIARILFRLISRSLKRKIY